MFFGWSKFLGEPEHKTKTRRKEGTGMKSLDLKVIPVIMAMIFISCAADSGEKWRDITGPLGVSEEITCVEGIRGADTVYAGLTGGLYISHDLGKTWARENVSSFGPRVTGIASFLDNVFLSSDEGLFIKEGKEKPWMCLEGEKDLKGICVYGDRPVIVTWTKDRIFTAGEDSWQDITPGAARGEIEKVTASGGLLYIASGGEVIFGKPGAEGWDRITLVSGDEDELPEEIENGTHDEDDEVFTLELIRDITPIEVGGALVSTEKGIYMLDAVSPGPLHIDTTGLPSGSVVTALAVNTGIFACTDKKVFLRPSSVDGSFWEPILEVSDGGTIKDIKMYRGNDGQNRVLLAFSKRLYVFSYDKASFPEVKSPGELSISGERFSVGPDIKEVHKMAIEYAEVSPGKIEAWRKAAKWRAILPRLALGYDEDHSDNVEIYTSATQQYLITGPREKKEGWDISLTWDLPDLIWTSAQTSIDVRSKLMVQLRDDILEDVTRLYFERKRLIEGAPIQNEKDKKDMARSFSRESRIEELTAYIDAYTGGMFSRSLDTRAGI